MQPNFDAFAASMTDREFENLILARLADLETEFFSTEIDLERDEPSAADFDCMGRMVAE